MILKKYLKEEIKKNFSVYTFGTFIKSTMNEISLAMASDLLSSIDDENLNE